MLLELFKEQKEQLNYFFDNLRLDQAEQVLDVLYECKGKLAFTGIGKSGLIAEKIAKTLSSTGTRAFALSAVDALHGDIGMLDSNDMLIVLSKSGHTQELRELIRSVKLRGIPVMGWFCNDKANLSSECDLVMQLPIEKELCPFDLAPTTSTEVQLVFGNLITVALMRRSQFPLSQYALNHPAGSIGKKSTLLVNDLMLSGDQLPLCRANQLLSEVLVELTNKRCGCVVVVNENMEAEGVFTDGDLRRAIQHYSQSAFEMKMTDLMTKTFMHVTKDALAADAVSVMQHDSNKRVMMLPVLDGNKVEGLIMLHDIINHGV